MPPILPLLARRQADPPTWRNLRSLPAPELGHPAYSPIERGASLLAEPLAFRTQRPGDHPTDIAPERVPLDARHPTAGLDIPSADVNARAHARAIAMILREGGAVATDMQGEMLNRLDTAIQDTAHVDADGLAAGLASTLNALDEGEHGLGNELAAQIEESLQAIADLGLRAPIDALREYYTSAPEPTSED